MLINKSNEVAMMEKDEKEEEEELLCVRSQVYGLSSNKAYQCMNVIFHRAKRSIITHLSSIVLLMDQSDSSKLNQLTNESQRLEKT